jgi:hypothetical protein
MTQSIPYLSFIMTSIRPSILPTTRNPIITKLTLIDDAICPGKLAFTVQESVIEFPIVLITIPEDYLTRTIEAFSIDLAVLRTG